MAKRKTPQQPMPPRKPAAKAASPLGYARVLSDMKQRIADTRRRAAATVNRELVMLYSQVGRVIVQQQETAKWGDAVEQLSANLRIAFPDMKAFGDSKED